MIKSDKLKLPKNIPFAKVFKKEENSDNWEQKLLDLLNQYMEDKWSSYRFKEIMNHDFFCCTYIEYWWLWYETILSKRFLFIDWLVRNDKLRNIWWYQWRPKNHLWDYAENKAKEYVVITMLALSDNPVEFLISLLK